MTRAEAARLVGGVGATSKMPGPTFGLPIEACRLGAILRARQPESVCARCYAGRYRPSVLTAQRRRLAILRAALADPELADRWVDAWRVLLARADSMRWHDAGDLQGPGHLALLARVAIVTPWCRHWVPTRETGDVVAFLATGGTLPPNLRVRVSAALVGRPCTLPPALDHEPQVARSAVQRPGEPLAGYQICPASGPEKERDHCGPCRACWGPEPVAYVIHECPEARYAPAA